jgi:BolA protein
MPILVGTASADKARSKDGHPNEHRMRAADRIRGKLAEVFAPVELQVIDESDQHKGHAGARPEGETHFRVRIVAEAFRGKSRVEVHRMVNAALGAEFAGGLHALAIEARAPANN